MKNKKVKEAVPKLLENAKGKGTVVRWSAAFALTEIARSNSELQEELILDVPLICYIRGSKYGENMVHSCFP